jgi:acetyl-CoA carboxylase biotin carboxylase subunit
MISKVIVWARKRDGAIDRMKRALYEYKISGVKTSIKYLESIIKHPAFETGQYDTHFIEKYAGELKVEDDPCDADCEDLAVITAFIEYSDKLNKFSEHQIQPSSDANWKTYGRSKGVIRI